MEVKKTLETENGSVVFEGILTQEEADYVITIGLNELLKAGALPYKVYDDDELVNINIPNSEYDQ